MNECMTHIEVDLKSNHFKFIAQLESINHQVFFFQQCIFGGGWNDEDQYMSTFESLKIYNTFYYLEYQLTPQNFPPTICIQIPKYLFNYKIEKMLL